jgi:hypothetical protein
MREQVCDIANIRYLASRTPPTLTCLHKPQVKGKKQEAHTRQNNQ